MTVRNRNSGAVLRKFLTLNAGEGVSRADLLGLRGR
jgi:hypothetical protein